MPMQRVHKTEAVEVLCQPMPMQTVHSTEAVGSPCFGNNSKGTDASLTDKHDPWFPPNPPTYQGDSLKFLLQRRDFYTKVRATSIVVPDRTPKTIRIQFIEIWNQLTTAVKKDSVPCFLRLFQKYTSHMVFGFIITPQTLDFIIRLNALRCAKLVLEGKDPKLNGQLANPNYITSFGYFPLHQAAERFSVDMIELLLHYGASANQRTSGERIFEGLLPLHVAIEGTCQHKYLEDNLFADQKYRQVNAEYIYKLIHLICLPEMKIFLDTIRLLASHTDNVVDELWSYIKHGKIVPAAIFLLAAHGQFRKLDGIDMIKVLIEDSMFSLEREGCGSESGKNTKAQKELKERKIGLINAMVLVRIVLKAGEALDAYIQTHPKPEASNQEVLGKVSAILQDCDVGLSGKGICIEDLECCPYNCEGPDDVIHEHGDTDVTKVAIGSPTVKAEAKNGVIKKKLRRGQELSHTRNKFHPHWRSVLTCQFIYQYYPPYAPKKELPYDQEYMFGKSRKKSSCKKLTGEEPCIAAPLGLCDGRSWQSASNYQSRRLFGTAASTLLKMLKRA